MPIKLLFVDDEVRLQSVIGQLFRREVNQGDYQLEFALNGKEALAKLTADPQIDIVLTDLNMPEMNGLALLGALQDAKSRFSPVLTTIVLSAYGDLENIRRAMNAGAFDFLTKPIDFEDMKLTIIKAVQHVQHLKAVREKESQAEESLKRLNRELETRVKERTMQLEKSNAELNAFAHTVAHDLKNPLGIVTGYVDYALDFFDELSPEELRDSLKDIKRYGYKSVNIVEELLLLAGIRKLEVPHHVLNMGDIVERATKRLSLMIEEYQGIVSEPEQWPAAIGYDPWIEEVWVNYISNGLKYGGNPPHLTLGATLRQNDTIRFWVRDNGQGIGSEDQRKLFNEFIRLDKAPNKGYGLGLSIVRRIIEKLDGQVGVESSVGQGSEFYFTLPAKQS